MNNHNLDNSLLQSQRELNKKKNTPIDENTWMKQVSSRKSQQISSEELSQILRKHSLLNKLNSSFNNIEGSIKNRNSMIINRGNIKNLLITENTVESNQSLNSDKIKNQKLYESSDSLSESSNINEEENEIQNDNQKKIEEEDINFSENNDNNIKEENEKVNNQNNINNQNDNNLIENKDKNENIKDEELKNDSQNLDINNENNLNNQNEIENDININNNSNDNKNNDNNLENNTINNKNDEIIKNNYPSEIKEDISEEIIEDLNIKNNLKDKKNSEEKKEEFEHIILSTEDKFQMLRQSYLKVPNLFTFKNDKNEEENEESKKNIDLNNEKKIIIEPMINNNNPELELLSYNPGNKSINPFSLNSALMRNKNYLTERIYNNKYINNEIIKENNEENNDENNELNNKESQKNKKYIGRNNFKYLQEISKSPSENNIFIEKYGNSPFNSIEYNSLSPEKIREDFYNEKNDEFNNKNKKFNTISNEKDLFKKKNKKDNLSNKNYIIMPSNLENSNYGSTIFVSEDTSYLRKIINDSRKKYLQNSIPSLKDSLKTINKKFSNNNFESIENEINNENSVFKGGEKCNTQRINYNSNKYRLFNNKNKGIKKKNSNLKNNNSNKYSSSILYNSRNQKRNNIYQLSYYKNNGFRTNLDLTNKISLSPNSNDLNNIKEKEILTDYKNKDQKIITNSMSSSILFPSKNNISKDKYNLNVKNKFKKNNSNQFNNENDVNDNKIKKEKLFYKFADYKLKKQLLPPNSVNSKYLKFFK